MQNKEFVKVKIQEIIFQAQFGNLMAPLAPNHMTQTLAITFPAGIQATHSSNRNSSDPYISPPQADQLRRSYLSQIITPSNKPRKKVLKKLMNTTLNSAY